MDRVAGPERSACDPAGSGHLFHDIADEWVTEVEQFLTGAPRPVPTQRFLTTLVSADIVGSPNDRAYRGRAVARRARAPL